MNSRIRILFLLLPAMFLPLATLAGSPELPRAAPEDVGMSSERLARIAPVMQGQVDKRLVPGVITAVALMMLREEGRFQLQDPVSRFLPEFSAPKVSTTRDGSGKTGELVPAERPITIRALLTHTAGLANSHIGNTGFYQVTMQPQAEEKLDAYVRRLASLLTTRGRRGGEDRSLPLLYQPCGEGFIIVASRGGSPRHPGWYLNLREHPDCEARVGRMHYRLNARTLEGDERSRWWHAMTRFWPA